MMSALRTAVLACALLLPGGTTAVAGDIDTVRSRLIDADVLRADFRQQKSLAVLSRALTSQGGVIVVKGRGILWHIREPYERFVLVRPDRVIEWEDDSAATRSSKSTGAVLERTIKIILAAVSGDIAYLNKYFTIAVEDRPAGWHMSLTPSSASGQGLFSRIELKGDRFVENVVVASAGGDVTTIRLHNFRADPARLTDREMGYFAQ